MNSKMDCAIELARGGWPVFPTHLTDKNGVCSCGSPDCNSAGKHPRTPSCLKDATTEEQTIRN